MFGKGSKTHYDVQLGPGRINIWVAPTLQEWAFTKLTAQELFIHAQQ